MTAPSKWQRRGNSCRLQSPMSLQPIVKELTGRKSRWRPCSSQAVKRSWWGSVRGGSCWLLTSGQLSCSWRSGWGCCTDRIKLLRWVCCGSTPDKYFLSLFFFVSLCLVTLANLLAAPPIYILISCLSWSAVNSRLARVAAAFIRVALGLFL